MSRLSRVLHSVGETDIHNYMLGYDSLSRITSETDSKVSDYGNTYVYDAYGQLVRENNKRLNKTILYTYDNIGNIIRVQGYDYTTDDEVSGTPIENVFVYGESMPDKLTSFNGKNITYDANGRVSTYDGWTYAWERDKLKSIEKPNATDEFPPKYTFTYNAYGERTEKQYIHVESLPPQTDYLTNSTTTYKYDLCGRLIRETRSLQYSNTASVTKELTYLYDNLEIVGLIYTDANGASTYYYDKNVSGDIIAILDSSGTSVVKYKYDAYGNCEYYDSVAADLAETNPIRYRSYYYDADTGLYYLQARYYNPEWRRFISPDSTDYLDSENPTGLNLYAYCGNDSINYADPSGHAPKWWQSILLGVGIIAVAALAAAAIVYTGGGATAFFTVAGKVALDGLKIATVAGATSGIVRSGRVAVEGGDIGDVGKSLVLGFSDGFLVGSIYAAGSMIFGAASFRISGLFNNGYGWSSGSYLGGYRTPRTPGISLITHKGGINGGRSFGLDLDIFNGLHFHTNKFGVGKRSKWIKAHHWYLAPIGIGFGVGLSDGWSEW